MRKLVLIYGLLFSLIITGCSTEGEKLVLEGKIENNIISANTTVAGKILQLNIKQGQPVKKGDLLAVIDNTNQKYAVEQLQAIVNIKKAKLEELTEGSRKEQIAQAEAQTLAAKAQLELLISGSRTEQIEQAKNGVLIAEEALKNAQTTYAYLASQHSKLLELFTAGAIPKNDVDAAKYKLDSSAVQLTSAKYQVENAKQQLILLEKGPTAQEISRARANYDAARAQLSLLTSGATKQLINSAKADLDQAIAQFNQAKSNLGNYNIVALEDGIVVSQNFQLGDVVNIGNNIADIAIINDLYVVCYIPHDHLDKVYYNQTLTVSTSLGIQKGKVNFIDLEEEYLPEDQRSNADDEPMATKIKVVIKDQKGRLKSGMSAKIEVPLH